MNDINEILTEIELLDPPYAHSCIADEMVLDAKAVLLGYCGISDLISVLEDLPELEYCSARIEILQDICALRAPKNEIRYFQFFSHENSSLSFESIWVGWDDNRKDIREPRLVNGLAYLNRYRSYSDEPVYVIQKEIELHLWQHLWLGFALIEEKLAREHLFECFAKKVCRASVVFSRSGTEIMPVMKFTN